MASPDENKTDKADQRHAAFPATRWSVILEAQDNSAAALASFCSVYWFPLYSYARQMNLGAADAEDLTQAFFERLLAREVLNHARRERGRLRDFLLRSFKNFAAEEWRRLGAQKRSAGQPVLQIDSLAAEERLDLAIQVKVTPELEYERAWARELLRQALLKLEAAYQLAGNLAIFNALRDQLADGFSDQTYRQIAAKLGSTETSVRFAAFKLRQRYREVLHEIVANTVPREQEVEEELAYLQTLFQR